MPRELKGFSTDIAKMFSNRRCISSPFLLISSAPSFVSWRLARDVVTNTEYPSCRLKEWASVELKEDNQELLRNVLPAFRWPDSAFEAAEA